MTFRFADLWSECLLQRKIPNALSSLANNDPMHHLAIVENTISCISKSLLCVAQQLHQLAQAIIAHNIFPTIFINRHVFEHTDGCAHKDGVVGGEKLEESSDAPPATRLTR